MANIMLFTSQPLIYCTCGGIPMNSTTEKCLLTSKADTIASGQGQWTSHPWYPGTTVAIAGIITKHGTDNTYPALIEGHPSEIATVPLECTNGTDLSNLSAVMVRAIGY